jgi:tetratricopeptide (TPR) repeat protein
VITGVACFATWYHRFMAGRRKPGSQIESLIAAERWSEARRRIRALLREHPDDHWLLSRLALTYYEQRAYQKALELDTRALELAPRCPLALWGLAGAQQMLGQTSGAELLYLRLIRRGPAALARGPCGEGIRWARRLVADCWYRLGQIREAQGQLRRAKIAYHRHVTLRVASGSIYSAADVRSRLRALRG